jgi:hypothetical protein
MVVEFAAAALYPLPLADGLIRISDSAVSSMYFQLPRDAPREAHEVVGSGSRELDRQFAERAAALLL